MKTRLLFWLLLACGIGTMTLHSTRDTSAGVNIPDSKCEDWKCKNKTSTGEPFSEYYQGYAYDANGQRFTVQYCDLGNSQTTIVTCMVPHLQYTCVIGNPEVKSVCVGWTVAQVPNQFTCFVDFNHCSSTLPPPPP